MASTLQLYRVFVSSTFDDFAVERNALQAEVFPRLQDFCRRRGARFQAVDLRWGVSEEAGRDQQTLHVCLQEIDRCQRTTPRPNFIALLGSRYGWRPLPPRIPADEFHVLFAALTSDRQNVFRRWYRRDDNALPSHYLLQPIPDQAAWDRAEQDLRSVLRDAVAAQGWPADDRRRVKYETSATHQEIIHGLLQPPDGAFDPRRHVCCYLRALDLPQRVEAHSRARDFADYAADPTVGGFVRDADAAERLERLTAQIRRALPAEQVHGYAARWSGQGIELDLPAFCRRVEADLQSQIEAELQRLDTAESQPGGEEARVHHEFAAERAHGFVGRQDALVRIAAYLAAENVRDSLVIAGPSGVGKSALLARAAQLADPGCLVLQRYLGVTPAASSLRALLTDLCREIATHMGGQIAPPTDPRELAAEWSRRLEQAAAGRPVVLFLDALDQLSSADDAHTLFWLPRPLPPGVKLVASVLEAEGEAGACTRAVEALVPSGQRLRLGPLSEEEGAELLERWLQEAGRTLQRGQREAAAQRLSQCGLPLYIRGVFQEVRRWASYDGVQCDLAADTAGLLRQLFDRLEERRHHSPVLVRISLGYLAAGRHGLTEDELLDVLSADRAVMQDFHDHSPTERGKPATERLPPIVWSRLRFDLADYLAEREADGTAVLAFFHREVSEVVRSRCLQGQDRLDHHRGLARYFGEQVLDQADSAGGRQFNQRKLAELPYQQSEGELWPELQGLLAGDFAFLRAKTEAGQVFDLVEDYNRAHPGLSEVPAFAPWSHFVRGQAPVLALDPELFFQQMLNEPMDSPVSRAAEERVRTAEAPERWLEWVNRPREFMPPACLQVLTGHTRVVEGVAVSADGRIAVSGAGDQTVRVWDLTTGQCRATLTGHTGWVQSVALSADGRIAISGADEQTVRVWDLTTGQCRATLTGHTSGVYGVAVSADGRIAVSGALDGTVRVWDLAAGQCRATLTGHTYGVVCVAVSADGRTAVSGADDQTVRVWDLATGRCRATLTGHTGWVRSVAVSADGRTAVSAAAALDDQTVRVWDLATGQCRATLTGHRYGVVCVAVFADGRTAVSGAPDGTVQVWDLATGQCRATLTGHTSMVRSLAVSADGRTAVSGARDDTVRVWDLATGQRRVTLPSHTFSVLSVAVSADGRTAVSGAYDRRVCVWDLATGQCRATLTGHTGPVGHVAVSADGRTAVSGAYDQTVRVWDLATGQCRFTLTGHTSVVRSVAVSADGRTAVSDALEVRTQVVDAETGQCRTPVKAQESPRGGVREWDLATGQCRAVYPWDSDQARSAWARVRTERSVRAQVASHGVELLATATGAVVARIPGSFTVADCSPDGRLVVAGDGGGQVYCLRLRCRAD